MRSIEAAFPHHKPHNGNNEGNGTQHIAQRPLNAQSLMRHKDEGGTHGGHQQCGHQGNDVCLTLAHKKDGDGPEGEDAKRLVSPTKILPNNIEAIGVLHLPQQQQDGAEEHRHTNHQTTTFASLLNA